MKCPSCNSRVRGNDTFCNKCRFWLPGMCYFANEGSFGEWKDQPKQAVSIKNEQLPVQKAELPPIKPAVPVFTPSYTQNPTPSYTPTYTRAYTPTYTPAAQVATATASYSPAVTVSRGRVTTAQVFSVLSAILIPLLVFIDDFETIIDVDNRDVFHVILVPDLFVIVVWMWIFAALLSRKSRGLMILGLLLLSISGLLEQLISYGMLQTIDYEDFEFGLVFLIDCLEKFIPAVLLLFVYLKRTKMAWFFPGLSLVLIIAAFCLAEDFFPLYSSFYISYGKFLLFYLLAGRYFYLLKRSAAGDSAP